MSRRAWLAGVALVLIALLLPTAMALLAPAEATPVATLSLDRGERPVGAAATLALLAPGLDPSPLARGDLGDAPAVLPSALGGDARPLRTALRI